MSLSTPSPWRAEPTGETDSGNFRVSYETAGMGYQPLPQTAANSRLLENAPALLDALKETLKALEAHLDESCRDRNLKHRDLLCPCNQQEVVRAKAAIAAATQPATKEVKP